MSIAFQTENRIQRPDFGHGMPPCIAIYDSSDTRRFSGDREEEEEEDDTCSSSSIGRNSDTTGESSDVDGDSGDGEAQSSFKGPLDCLDALEEVLPIKRGISSFYSGKSKSFTSLADVSSCGSVQEIAKPENAYTRKRKNLLAHTTFFDKTHSPNRAITKRPSHSNKTTLGLGLTMSRSDSTGNIDSGSSSSTPSPPAASSGGLPPRIPQTRKSVTPPDDSPPPPVQRNFATWRSFSLSDLQGAAAADRA
jgi:hypothetical protein